MGLRASGFGAFDPLYGSRVTVGFQKTARNLGPGFGALGSKVSSFGASGFGGGGFVSFLAHSQPNSCVGRLEVGMA